MPNQSPFLDNSFWKLIYNAAAIANIADNAASSPLTNIYVALHTADPSGGSVQNANEVTYTGYARVAVARTTSGWTVTGNVLTPVSVIPFGIVTAGSGTITWMSTGVAASGATTMLNCAPISPPITIAVGTTPQISTASSFTLT